ncbi:hypothetical protein EXIGLDRAFT_766765 [Exidia glandulosa HHB12029]|uniref:Uncharacterized protein n=1 Tax=Exidia glandulosa HHB12029 TaxID=1314781 RepID=A0A165DUX7_EXIGL|nr:hypothetical protein EXIGLDRAFT_841484 [Exidia glandulosa HHB12029]KZV94893.1 hypothetical protein EXIGLDRAFT_766765 [Exidia glandulosa HHB12029]
MSSTENQYGQGKSHATGESKVPAGLQERLPREAEEYAPDSIHPTGSSKGQSHATGKSIVPEKLQEVLPESVERAVPNAIHDTSGLPPQKK